VSGDGISWAICKPAPCSRQIPHQLLTTQFFTGWMPFLPPNQQRQSTEGYIGSIGSIEGSIGIMIKKTAEAIEML